MTHDFGLIEFPLSALRWNGKADRGKFHSIQAFNDYKKKLRESIIREGILKPPVVEWHLKYSEIDGPKFRVHEGNHRVEIANELGWEKIKVRLEVVDYNNDWIVEGLKYLGVNNA